MTGGTVDFPLRIETGFTRTLTKPGLKIERV